MQFHIENLFGWCIKLRKNVYFAVLFLLVYLLGVASGFLVYSFYTDNLGMQNNHEPLPAKSNADVSQQEYVWIGTMTSHPMYVNHDQKALKKFGKDMGVKVTVEGPADYDIPGQAAAIEKVIKRNPAGRMVLGMERALVPLVNKAIEAGIPTITVDADLIESKRIAFVGSNWYNIGVRQAETLAKLIGGKGKVAIMGIFGADNMEQGFAGFKSVMANYPDIKIIGEFDDMADVDEARRITEEIISRHPDIAGIAGFDTNSGPGIAAAVKAADMAGKIKITCVDIEPLHLKYLKEGVIHKLFGQKRELFTYYGARLLYDINNPSISITGDDKKNGIIAVPYIIDTGFIEVDAGNVDNIIESIKLK